MLDLTRTRIKEAVERDLLSTVTVSQEGLAMQGVMEGGIMKARPSNATANSIFLGISWGERMAPPATLPMMDAITVASAAGSLSKVSTGTADIVVWRVDTGATLTRVASAPATGEYALDANNQALVFNAAQNGVKVIAQYRYTPNVLEIQALYGDNYPGPRAVNTMLKVGIIQKGIVYTDQFDTTVNWATADTTVSAETMFGIANGRISLNATGCSLAGYANVIEAPTVGKPWLGIELYR